MRKLTEDEEQQVEEAKEIRDKWLVSICGIVLFGIIIFSIYVFNEN